MCIRDRDAHLAHIFRVDLKNELFAYEIKQDALDLAELMDGCLLYTSDAADERSSVDLGGRRIIKKKKNIELGEIVSRNSTPQRRRTLRM